MARIRSIKPEFPQSESMGNVSRDSRLAFVLLWTLADDEGRLRGNSRMLASLLFPYDDDAPGLIDAWLMELEEEGCIERYKTDGASYVQICNWLIHQKIDKPSKSKLPCNNYNSRILANPRECSSGDLRIKDQGSKDQGGDQGEDGSPPTRQKTPRSTEPELLPAVADATPAPNVPVESETALQAHCRKTWSSYSDAYADRYSVAPVRNAKVNSAIKSLVQRIGGDEAPDVAAWFVHHPGSFYTQRMHDVGSLLADCEKLRTEWATGKVMTTSKARQADRTGGNSAALEEVLARMEAQP